MEATEWEASKHNMGYALTRTQWVNIHIRACTNMFCKVNVMAYVQGNKTYYMYSEYHNSYNQQAVIWQIN